MASVFEQLQEKYRGFTVDYSGEEKKTTITFQGTREMCLEAMNSTYKVNTKDSTYGNIESVRLTNQGNGPIWDLEVVYSISYDHSGNATGTGSAYGAKSSELSMSMLSLSLESRGNYRKKWNYNLYCTIEGASTPSWWSSAGYDDEVPLANQYRGDGVTKPTAGYYYEWGTSKSDLTPLPTGYCWHLVRRMTKPRSRGISNTYIHIDRNIKT